MSPKNKCAPGVKKNADGSCLPPGVLRFTPGCSTDMCAAKKRGDPALLERLRPEKPAKWLTEPRTWLDTNNINAVMRQYERAYRHFKYIGTLPIDAYEAKRDGSCVSEHKAVDIVRLASRGRTVSGMVFNLDRHDQSGSHWVMAAVDLGDRADPKLYYYDSFGRAPPKQVRAFFLKLIGHLDPAAAKRAVKNTEYSRARHQRGNSECGVFSLLALEAVLRGEDFTAYTKRKLTDEFAFKARDRLFS
jgi:hypothetical protein